MFVRSVWRSTVTSIVLSALLSEYLNMKDLATALEETVQLSGIPKSEIPELILDDKCRTTELSGLHEFTSLTKLSLCNVGLSTLSGFPHLVNLTKLILADNRITDGLEHLTEAGLTNLRVLSLAHNRISEISQLEPLKQLELTSLDLGECPLVQNTTNYRETVLEMLPTLRVLDNIDREGIELLDDDEEEEESEEGEGEDFRSSAEDDSSEDETSEDNSDEDDNNPQGDRMETEPYNLITSSEDSSEDEDRDDEEEPEEIHVSVLAGPPIAEGKSDDDQEYIVPDVESESEEDSYDSEDEISASHHFPLMDEGPSDAGPSQAPGQSVASPSLGSKRKRSPGGPPEDIPKDEDYQDL
eukprot:g1261.t1